MPAFPYLAKATIKYKSPHKQDLTFAKGETIRVTGVAPKTDPSDDDDDDDDDWLIGETLDGSRSGTFPGGFVEPTDEVEQEPPNDAEAAVASATSAPAAPGAIPTETPSNLQSSVIEEAPSHQADTIPEAAREAAQKGETEEAGFGAPLPPRPPSPDADEDAEETVEPSQAQEMASKHASEAPLTVEKAADGGNGTAEIASGIASGTATSGTSHAPANDATSAPSIAEAKSDPAPAKSPPALASKPPGMSSSFRDRLAAFNKPAESAPPPLPKGKPGGWKRPTPASSEAKPLLPGAPAPASTTAKPAVATKPSEPTETPTSSNPSGTAGGAFSAADAQSSIKMSLKERMAALQRNEAAAADAAPQLKPKPSVPGKIGAERRNVALQGMGLAPGAAVPVRKSSVGSGTAAEEAASEPTADQSVSQQDDNAEPAEEQSRDQLDDPATSTETGTSEEAQETAEKSGEPKEALTEEEQEAERRAAIAKRMAALGARRMGGGQSPFGAPAPPNRTKTASSVASAEGTTSEPGISLPSEPVAAVPSSNEETKEAALSPSGENEAADPLSSAGQDASEEPKVLAVPRRTAAPRKRKPVPQAAPAAAAAAGATAVAVGTAAVAEESDAAPPAADPESEAPQDVTESTNDATEHSDAAVAIAAEETTTKPDDPVEAVTASHDETEHEGVRGAHLASGAEEANAALTQPEPTSEQQLESDPEIAENQRELEEYLRGEGFYEESAQHEPEPETATAAAAVDDHDHAPAADTAVEAEPAHAAESVVESVPREDVTSPKPPSRPPSTRPPVPRTNLPPPPSAAEHEDISLARMQSPPPVSMSRRGSAIPPVPTSSLPTPMEAAGDEADDPATDAVQEDEEEATTGPVLAAPRPRMAIPTQDPDDEELLAAADTPAAVQDTHEASEAAPEEEQQPEELTEEEQEAQRRANLARRMAALGGQRIGAFPGMAPPPIMGAPMPARKAPVQASDETEEDAAAQSQVDQDAPLSPSRGPPRGGMAIPGLTAVPGMNAQQAEGDALERAKSPGAASIDAPARLASPPPVPTSPPPKPMSPPPPARPLPSAGDATSPPSLPPGRPSSTVPMANLDEAIRSASPANSSLGRRTSMKPPVPQGMSAHSRDSSTAGGHDAAEDRELATSPPPLPTSPPPLPVSPPPRPSSRAPPLPGHGGVPPRRQGSSASYASYGAGESNVSAVPSATTTPAAEQQPAPMVTPRTEASLPPTPAAAPSNISVGARQSSRDLDLMPSSRWWRHGLNPLRLPPTVAGRPDAILYADTSLNADTGVQVHKADIYMLFEDYSTTVISLSFQDDDLDETHTSLSQRHNFPPAKPSVSDLKQWSSSIGSAVAKMASDASKQSNAPVGDGSPRAFVQAILSSIPSALPPVGSSLGAPILTQVGPTVMDAAGDEVRPGDVVSCTQADFRGKKGLAPYHMTLGSQSDPTTGIVIEVEAKKNKLRCIVQSPNNKKGLPDELSLRLDDLKSGIVKVFRIAPRQGWVHDW